MCSCRASRCAQDIAAQGIPLAENDGGADGHQRGHVRGCRTWRATPRDSAARFPASFILARSDQGAPSGFPDSGVRASRQAPVPTARLYVVGRGDDPEDETFLESEAARLGLQSSVVFVGQLPQAQALRYVREADVCVSPFYPTPVLRSTSPTKLVEYMAMGKAVVANDHPEQKRVIEESGAGHLRSV